MWWHAFAMPELQRHMGQETEWWALGQSDTETKNRVNGPQGTAPEAVLWLPHTHIYKCTLSQALVHTHTNSRKTYIYFYITCFYSLSHFINLFAHILKGKQKVLTWKVPGLRLLKNTGSRAVRINREATAELQQLAPPTEETSEKLDPHVVR